MVAILTSVVRKYSLIKGHFSRCLQDMRGKSVWPSREREFQEVETIKAKALRWKVPLIYTEHAGSAGIGAKGELGGW